MSNEQQRDRGLSSLKQSREQRRRALVFGKVRLREAAPQFWLWTAVFFLAFGVIYWHWSERELGRQKSALMSKQRAIAQELTPRLMPLRDDVERWVMDLATGGPETRVADDLDLEQLANSNGIYLRLLAEDAATRETIRRAAQISLHDGFTSCLFVGQDRVDPTGATRCFSPSQCPAGELCNEWGLCSLPTQPFNLRLMYAGLRILSPEWTDELHAATSDYQTRVFERDLEKVAKTDIPIAIDLVSTARYFTVLLDEAPEGGFDALRERSEQEKSTEEGAVRPALLIQGLDHAVRLGIWEVASGRELFRGRFQAGAEFVPMGRQKTAPQRNLDAQQRQVNNCGIAVDFRARVASVLAKRRGPPTSLEANTEAPTATQAPSEPAAPSAPESGTP